MMKICHDGLTEYVFTSPGSLHQIVSHFCRIEEKHVQGIPYMRRHLGYDEPVQNRRRVEMEGWTKMATTADRSRVW